MPSRFLSLVFRPGAAAVALALSAAVWIPPAAAADPVATPPQQTRVVPFGEAVEVRSAVLRATAIVLSPDEQLRSLTQADSERWQVDFSEYGPDGATVPVLTVTPTDCDLTTNLVALTTRRVYSLLLHSSPCEGAEGDFDPSLPYDAVVRFRYPDRELTAELPVARGASAGGGEASEPAGGDALRFDLSLEELVDRAGQYRWRRRGRYRGPEPVLVTDDGTRTFLVFPEGVWKDHELPLLFLLSDDDERELVNYDVDGRTFIVRALFRRAVLTTGGEGRRPPRLVFTRKP